MTTITKAYEQAMKQSYSMQENSITIPADRLDEVVEIPLGFQPLGISSQGMLNATKVAIAAYFESAVCLVDVPDDRSNGLQMNVNWIRGADHGVESVRLFPNQAYVGGANRCFQAIFDRSNADIWVNRSDREFYRLLSPNQPGGRWRVTEKLVLQEATDGVVRGVHSATFIADGSLMVIEGTLAAQELRLANYNRSGVPVGTSTGDLPGSDFIYGLGNGSPDGLPRFVTDVRCKSTLLGIYQGKRLVVPGICGTGICFLNDGSALVTQYGQAYPGPFNGQPGKLVYIPARLFPTT